MGSFSFGEQGALQLTDTAHSQDEWKTDLFAVWVARLGRCEKRAPKCDKRGGGHCRLCLPVWNLTKVIASLLLPVEVNMSAAEWGEILWNWSYSWKRSAENTLGHTFVQIAVVCGRLLLLSYAKSH